MPVLPEVGSMITEPGPRIPRASASSIIASAIRSLMLPPGLARSSFAQTSTRGSKRRLIRTCGVLPMVARTEFAFIAGSLLQMTKSESSNPSRTRRTRTWLVW